ncbi:MAG: pyrroline-5-carboxylate reductase [Phycisphaeraceae bacterium]|nr:pyrroline-5-carboxylate reductase [Phycisphaeraceae bacterium]
MSHTTLALLGCGNMGLAIVSGAVHRGLLRPECVIGIDPLPEARSRAAELGIMVSGEPTEALSAERLLLAVKPQSFDALARTLASDGRRTGDDRVREVISVMSGWTRAKIGTLLGHRDGAARVIRAMPNLPATVGRGVTAIAAESSAPGAAADDSFAATLFRSVGEVVFVPESMLDAVTAVSGSGPAYLFLLAESMLAAAHDLGFDEETARTLVVGTLDGAVALLRDRGRPPAEIRAEVTSRGGTTEAATALWMERGVPQAMVEAILAAAARARELGHGPRT